MSTFDQGLIAQIKARLRIEDVIGRHVELRPSGTRLVAPCPFHQETKPSFSVNPEGAFIIVSDARPPATSSSSTAP